MTRIEGLSSTTIEAKVATVESILAELDADQERVTRLISWNWITDNLDQLPEEHVEESHRNGITACKL